MTYHQITLEERIAISTLRKEGLSASAIARRMGRHRSTISREFKRNCSRYDGNYRYSKAQQKTNGRRSRSRQCRHHTPEQYSRVNELLARKLSPEQIAGRLREQREFSISHETIYRHIWKDRSQGGQLYKHLRQSGKYRRKRHNSRDFRGRLSSRRMITERPSSVDARLRTGHWEVDTVLGRGDKHCIVTVVERKTGYVLIGKLESRCTADLNRRLISLIQPLRHRFKTITADNGTEFHAHRVIERVTDVTFYFAHPYRSWERGTNENTNGLIRQYLPKGTSMAALTQWGCNKIANELNSRPRKRLGYKTPEECFHGL